MPELPEVETVVRKFRPGLVGRRFAGFESSWPRNTSPSVRTVREAIVGRRVAALARRAKWIVFELEPRGYLLVHLRMSGRLEWAADHGLPAHTRAVWGLDDGRRLAFADARKFGRIVYSDALEEATASLGVEPLAREFTVARLGELLKGRSRRLKPLLLDQAVIAGLGNIYADEALFRAGLHPLVRCDRLRPPQVERLHAAIRAVLREAIRRNGTQIDWVYPEGRMQSYLRVYGRTGEPCVACRTPITALRVGQRGTHICPRCQRRPRR
jgi:formamidopyrimidine-DNA glycosylase